MKSIPVVVGAVLLVVLALGWFLFNREEAHVLLDQPKLEIPEEGQQPKRKREPADLDVVAAKPSVDNAEIEDPSQIPVIEVGEDEKSILVRVLDQDGQEPVPGIDVYAFSIDMFLTIQPRSGESAYDLIRRHGQHYRSDAKGLLRLRPDPRGSGLLAFTDHFLGMAELRGKEAEVELRVHPYPTVKVRVLNPSGEPVIGAQVAARFSRSDEYRSHPRDLNSARTAGPDGLARLAFLDPKGEMSDGNYSVALSGLFEEPIEEPIDIKAPPLEGITLVLPQAGRMSIRVEDADAAAVMDSQVMAFIRPPTESKTERRPSYAAGEVAMVPIIEGSGQSDPLVLGRKWEVTLMPGRNSPFKEMTQTVMGPQVDGEVVEVMFQLPSSPTRCVVRGRAIDEDGKPLSKVLLKTMSELRSGASYGGNGGRIITEEDGSFETSFDVKVAEGETRWRLIFSMGERGEPELRSVHDFTGRGPGLYELGDIQLLPDPILVRGRVVGPDGEGLAGISVSLSLPPLEGGDESARIERSMSRRVYGHSQQDGHFEIRAELEGSAFELRAQGQGFKFDSIRVSRGEEGVLIRMTALAGLKAQVLSWNKNESTEMYRVIYGLRPEGERFHGGHGLNQDGSLLLFQEPGRYDLSLAHSSNMEKTLFERKGLVLEAGRTLDLGDIQLASPGVEVQLLIYADGLDESSDRMRSRGRIRSFEVGESRVLQENHIGLQAEPHTIYVEELPIDIEVEVNGFRAQRWTLKQVKQKVRLKPGLEVRLRVSGLSGLPEDAVASLDLRFVDLQAHERQQKHIGSSIVHAELDCANPETIAFLAKPGTYQVRPSVGFLRNGGRMTQGLSMKEPIDIQVLDKDSPQSFNISLNPKEVAETFTRISEQR